MSNIRNFKTAKGSVYTVHPDRSTTRVKSYHPEHEADDVGEQPKSFRTFYVTETELRALSEFHAGGSTKVLIPWRDGRIGVCFQSGPHTGRWSVKSLITPNWVPAVGLTPVEIWDGGRKVHFGNVIIEIHT